MRNNRRCSKRWSTRRLFVNQDRTPKHPQTLSKLIGRIARRYAGVDLSPHQLRHLAAKILLDNSPGAFEVVKQVLGHENLKTTVNAYAGIDTRRACRHHFELLEKMSADQPMALRGRRLKAEKAKNQKRERLMARTARKHLPFNAWPIKDRRLWARAFEQDVFDEELQTAHLANATRVGLRTAYSRYLGFLYRHDPERLQLAPECRIDSNSIKALVAHLRESCRDTSIASLLNTLRLALGFIFPHRDWSWLKIVAKRIQAGVVPREDGTRGVTSAELYSVGAELMTKANHDVGLVREDRSRKHPSLPRRADNRATVR